MSSVVDEPRLTRRARQALQTRHDILSAGRALFAEQGYSRTSLAQIAEHAGVSVQTIYDSVGSKRALVHALNDLIDEESGVAELASRIPTVIDPRELLQIAVSITRNINERCLDIIGAVYSAASVEPELASVRDESRRRHREGIRRLTERLVGLDALSPALAAEVAADVMAAMTDPAVVRTYVLAYGWTWDGWQDWTVDALARLVLKQPPTRARARSRRD